MARLLEHSTQFLNSTLSDQLNGQMSRSTLSKKSQRHFCKWAFLHSSSFFEPDLSQSSCRSIVKLIFSKLWPSEELFSWLASHLRNDVRQTRGSSFFVGKETCPVQILWNKNCFRFGKESVETKKWNPDKKSFLNKTKKMAANFLSLRWRCQRNECSRRQWNMFVGAATFDRVTSASWN